MSALIKRWERVNGKHFAGGMDTPGIRFERSISDTLDHLEEGLFQMIFSGAPAPIEMAELLLAQLRARGHRTI